MRTLRADSTLVAFYNEGLVVFLYDEENADEHVRSQRRFVCDRSGDVAVDFLGRFESLDADWVRVWETIGLPVPRLPRTQVAGRPVRYAEYYSPSTHEAVRRRFARDVELFGYVFGP